MNVNRTIIGGRLTRDPELRHVGQNGTALCEFSLAVEERRKGQDAVTHFIDVVAWGRTAEVVQQFVSKGDPLLLEGRLTQERWEDKQTGKPRSRIKVTADRVHFVGGKPKGGSRAGRSKPSEPDGESFYVGDSKEDAPF